MDELISEFLAETSEGLSVLDLELVRLEQEPNNQEILGNIFRVMHTIKGTCGFLGLPRLASVAHAGEDVLGKIRDGALTISPEIISIILEAIDCIKYIMVHIEAHGAEPEGDDTELIQRLNACAEGEAVVAAAVPEPPEPQSPQEMEEIKEEMAETEAADEATSGCVSLDELERIFQETPVQAEDASATLPVDNLVQDNTPPAPAPKKAAPAVPAAKEKSPVAAKEQDKGKASASGQTIRVNLDALEGLMQMVSELVLTRNQLLQILRTSKDNAFASPLQRLNHITSDLQERVMKTRMQPVGSAWTPFPRLIRDLAIELGKKIELKQIGGDTELDRQLLELIKDPLTHMVRNSADHGVERPEDRLATGKPETGTITLQAYHEGGHIIMEIKDDGKGISPTKLKEKIIEKGLATEKELETMSEAQILQFIFKPGFSTAEKITSVSGRGVGMDVVKTNIEKISGTIELNSIEGKGSAFRIKIPLTLAIMPVLIFETCHQRFAIPQAHVLEMVRTGIRSEYHIEYINEAPILRLRGALLPLISLKKILHLAEDQAVKEKNFVVVCELGGYHFGLIVDRVYDTEEIVVKPVAPILQDIEVYSGCTILGDGRVIMILDPNGVIRAAGQNIMSHDMTEHGDDATKVVHEKTRFLLFNTDSGAPKAIPLELVARLEEIDTSAIEYTNNGPVLQYRGSLMFLAQLDENAAFPSSGVCSVIVFSDHNMTMGLLVQEIMDIVEHDVSIMEKSSNGGFLGSIVIGKKTHDIVDVGYFFRKRFSFLLAKNNEGVNEVRKPRILFVDDSPFFRKFIPPALMAAGYQVTTAEDPVKALSILDTGKKFSAIITDMNMPEMSGAEFAKLCKNDNKCSDIPIVALSSQTSEQIEAREDISALDAFVSKTNHTLLLETISQLLSGDSSYKEEGVA